MCVLPRSGLGHKDYRWGEFKIYCFGTCMDIIENCSGGGGGGGGGVVASFPGSHSQMGEESLVALGGLNRGLPLPGFWRYQSDCRTNHVNM